MASFCATTSFTLNANRNLSLTGNGGNIDARAGQTPIVPGIHFH